MARRLLQHRKHTAVLAPDSPPQPNPDHAWKLLDLVDGWIRHSDAKAGVTLAFSGVLGTVIFNLVKDFTHRTPLFDILAVSAGVLLVLTAALCAWTLNPRIHDKHADPNMINHVFFGSISHHFKGDRRRYREALRALTADPVGLVNDLADQIHVNSGIATTKAKYAKWAIRAALATSAVVGGLATVVGASSL